MGERTKAVLAALSGALAALVEDYGMILLLGCAFISLDLVTGLAKAKISGTVSSAVGRKGFWRKAALLAALAFGICMDKLMGGGDPRLCLAGREAAGAVHRRQ